VAQILCINVDRIDPARSLHDLGMDSLMGVELALGMEQRFGVRLPAMMLTEGPTVERVSARIVERLLSEENRESTHGEQLGDLVNTLAAQHNESVSEGELAATVAEVQQQVRRGTGLIP
jgi:acyl carrier protein